MPCVHLRLYCGLRWCDVKDLTYANVDYSNKLLKFEPSKTKAHSAARGVVIPLNDGLLLSNGANIKTVVSILGHSGLAHTEKYTRAVDSLKQAAIDSMPPLKIE